MLIDNVSLATTLLLLVLPLVLFTLFLRRRLHAAPQLPLPPGPRGWPILGALPLLGRLPHAALAALAKRYGPVMHLNLGTIGFVVASSPAAARAFLQTLDIPFADRPVNIVSGQVAYGGQNLVFGDYGPLWKLLRRLTNAHLLGTRALSQWAAARRSEVGRMVRSILELSRRGEPVRVQEMTMVALANILGVATMSRRVFDSDGAESSEYKTRVLELMRLSGLVNIGDFVPFVAWLDIQGYGRRAKMLHEKFDALMTRMLREHAATASQRKGTPDFVDHLLADCKSSEEREVVLSDANIKALILVLHFASQKSV